MSFFLLDASGGACLSHELIVYISLQCQLDLIAYRHASRKILRAKTRVSLPWNLSLRTAAKYRYLCIVEINQRMIYKTILQREWNARQPDSFSWAQALHPRKKDSEVKTLTLVSADHVGEKIWKEIFSWG